MRTKLFIVFAGMILISGAVGNRFLERTVRKSSEANAEQTLLLTSRAVASVAATVPKAQWAQRPWQHPMPPSPVSLALFGADGLRVAGQEPLALNEETRRSEHITAALEGRESIFRGRFAAAPGTYITVTTPINQNGRVVGAVRAALDNTLVEQTMTSAYRTLGLAIVLLLGVAGLAAWAGPRIFSGGISDLLATAARMAKGDLGVRSPINPGDPLAPLAQALDLMAGNLSRSLSDLKLERDLVGRILERMEEGVLVLDGERRITLINPALRDMLMPKPAVSPDSSRSRRDTMSVLDVRGRMVLEVFRHAELSALLDRSQDNERVRGEVEVRGPRPRRMMVTATRFQEGGYMMVFVDVTEIRRLESLRRDFVANVSHELRTPVAAIRSAGETLPLAIKGQDPQAALRFVDIIERNADRLQSLVEELLDLSRIESREYRLQIETLVPTRIVNQIFGLFRDRAERRKIALINDVPSTLPAVHTDRRALETVLSNLIDNAVKYCPEGAQMVVRGRQEGNHLRLDVEDSGRGIEAKHLPRLFERFYRVDEGRARARGGTGLGLSIVKHLVEAMGGTTTVASTVGVGTTFTVRLPVKRTDSKPSPTSIQESFGS